MIILCNPYRLLEIAVILPTASCYSCQTPIWLLCSSMSDFFFLFFPFLCTIALRSKCYSSLVWLHYTLNFANTLLGITLWPYGLFISLTLPILALSPKVQPFRLYQTADARFWWLPPSDGVTAENEIAASIAYLVLFIPCWVTLREDVDSLS